MGSKKPYFAVLLIQTSFAGMSLLSKAAFDGGMSPFVFLFYRQAIGTLFLVPLSLFCERKSRPPFSFGSCCKIFMLAFLGITIGLNAYGVGVNLTSATLGAAAFNCLPVTTFFFALLLGLEKVSVRKAPGVAKMVGIVLCITGVAILTFYKGPHLKPFFNNQLRHHPSQSSSFFSSSSSNVKWIIGCFLLVISSVSWGLWLVLQAQFLKTYPSPLSFTSLQITSSAFQSLFVAIAFERNPAQWKLGFNIRLVAVVYCGIMVTCFGNFLQSWVIKVKGPVFQAVSTPLNLVVTMTGSLLLLSESICVGSIMGAVILVGSLYSVLWGKCKEQKSNEREDASAGNESEKQKETSNAEAKMVDQV